jgi:phage shock protein PspC (stress-responsive transcriptional regulator)
MTTDTLHSSHPRRLTRSVSDKKLGGVAGGLGDYFSVDPILFRIGFAAATLLSGVGLLAYLALLAFVPSAAGSASFSARPTPA